MYDECGHQQMWRDEKNKKNLLLDVSMYTKVYSLLFWRTKKNGKLLGRDKKIKMNT